MDAELKGSVYLSPYKVSADLGVHVYTVLRWIKSGKLKAFFIGREWRVRESDLEAFIELRCNQREGTAA